MVGASAGRENGRAEFGPGVRRLTTCSNGGIRFRHSGFSIRFNDERFRHSALRRKVHDHATMVGLLMQSYSARWGIEELHAQVIAGCLPEDK